MPIHTPPAVSATYTRVPSTIHRSASNVCGWLLDRLYQWSSRCVTDAIDFPVHRHERIPQMLCEEAVMWRHLKHPNILPLLGVTISPPQLISDWISAGDLSIYMEDHPDADRIGLVRVPFVVGIPRSLPSIDIRRREGPQLPPFSQCGSWGPQRSMYLSTILSSRDANDPASATCL